MAKEKPLSKREMEVLRLIAEGFTDDKIALKLNISKDTVNTHRKKLKEKIGAVNVASMIAIAFRKGFVN